MLCLATAVVFYLPNHPCVYISLYLAMIADIFLIKNKVPVYFIIGAIIFGAGHILNSTVMIYTLSYTLPYWVYIIAGVFTLLVMLIAYLVRGKMPKSIALVGGAYLTLHIYNVVLSIMLLVNGKINYAWMILVGYALYIFSDYIVNQVTYKKDIKRRDFYIMVTYAIGQLFIGLGLVLTIINYGTPVII